MPAKRIIPCLDIHNGRTVKGVNFVNLRDAGDPVELAKFYCEHGADELVFLDISATIENRKTTLELITSIARVVDIPFTVGGGINCIDDVEMLLGAGADKISINSAAYKNPNLISELAERFGSQCIVLAIDTKFIDNEWLVFLRGGRDRTETKTLDWAIESERLGAGEILLTSMNNDGAKNGYALDITADVANKLNIPVIASGGAGSMKHFVDVFSETDADAALAASVFHFDEIRIPVLKDFLDNSQIKIRR